MSIKIRILSIMFIIVYYFVLVILLKKKKMSLNYSILWFFSGVILFIISVFPRIIEKISVLIGIEVATNGLFAACIILETLILIFLTSVISDFATKNKTLIQQIALLENRVRALESKTEIEFCERK